MSDPTVSSLRLFLLRGFDLRADARRVVVTAAGQRLVALLAMSDRPVPRPYLAGTLWPGVPVARAGANLRDALWRLQHACPWLVNATPHRLGLDAGIDVDLHRARAMIRRLTRPFDPDATEPMPPGLVAAVRRELSGDLLPDWDDDWVLAERGRFRQLRLHALEVLAERLTRQGRHGEAVDVGLAAVSDEPLRESAQRTLIRAYLAEGNRAHAVRQYEGYEHLLRAELAVDPPQELRAMLRAALGGGPGWSR